MSRPEAGAVAGKEASEPVLQFLVARSLPYRARMVGVAVLVLTGFAAQVLALRVLPGVPFLLAALLLGWVRGYDNRLDRRAYSPGEAWTQVPFSTVEEIPRFDKTLVRWDRSGLDVSSGPGCLLWLLATVVVAAAAAMVAAETATEVGLILGVDAAILLLLQWFSGMRSVDRRPDVVLKASHLVQVVGGLRPLLDETGELKAQLRVGTAGKATAPEDVRIAFSPKAAPDHFLGVQGQVVLNRVSGTPHPYFYAVAVSRAGHGLLRAARGIRPPPKTVVETKAEGDVEVVVIRQATSKTSGYRTDAATSRAILETAVRFASGLKA